MSSYVEGNSSQWDKVHKISFNKARTHETANGWESEVDMTECPRHNSIGCAWYLPFLPWRCKCVCGGRDMYVFMHAHARSQTQLLFCRSYLPLLFFFLKAGSGSLIEFWGLLANLPGGIPSPGITSTYHLSWNRQVGARDWTQDLMLAWQALHQLSHLPSPCSALSDCLEVVELKRKNPQWQ